MDEHEIDSPLVEKKPDTSGQWLWKNLKPFGCVLCLVCLAAMLLMCFSSGPEPIEGYSVPESMEYYAADLEALAAELEQNVLPHVEGALGCRVAEGKVEVRVDGERFVSARSAILQYFDEDLLQFVQAEK